MTAFGIASLGMIGMLPLNTFWSKYHLMRAVPPGIWPLALVLVGSGLINAFCFIPTVVAACWRKGSAGVGESEAALTLAPLSYWPLWRY